MIGFLIYLLLLLNIHSIFIFPHEKAPFHPAKVLPSWEHCSRVPYTFQAL